MICCHSDSKFRQVGDEYYPSQYYLGKRIYRIIYIYIQLNIGTSEHHHDWKLTQSLIESGRGSWNTIKVGIKLVSRWETGIFIYPLKRAYVAYENMLMYILYQCPGYRQSTKETFTHQTIFYLSDHKVLFS